MTEIDITIRYGITTPEKAGSMSQEEASEGVTVRIFEEAEDNQWRTGALMRKAKSRGISARFVFSEDPKPKKEVARIDAELANARKNGRVPFRVSGSSTSVPGFLEQAGVTEVELIA